MSFSRATLGVICALTIGACSSGPKRADIATDANPTEEVKKLESGINEGLANQYDVLADKNFSKSQDYLAKAKRDMAKNKSAKDILDDVRYGLGYLDKAADESGSRAEQAGGILTARKTALDSGARNYPPTRARLKDLDDDMRGYSDNLRKVSAERISKLEAGYLDLQLAALSNAQTGKAEAQINAAKKKGAGKYTPKTLKTAELDLKTAQHQIAANRDNPGNYADAVAKSAKSAEYLSFVIAEARKHGKTLDEDSAITIVNQNIQIGSLKSELAGADAESAQMQSSLAEKERKLKASGAILSLQESLEKARKEFSKDEAEVYQQGDKLLLRLKAMHFPSGSADLPAESLALLSKVKEVATELGPKNVVIEGHTDSTGKAATNQSLSQARAQAVAAYLGSNGIEEDKVQAVGFGFKKPIASNKSKAGRAQNRRVDVIITPAIPESPSSQQ